MSNSYEHFYQKALELVQLISPTFIEGFGNTQEVIWKSVGNPVTLYDKKIEAMSREFIFQHFPDHQVLGEEDGLSDQVSDYQWIIDPIDGTNNYIRKLALVSYSLALRYKGEIIVGIIANPILNEVFSAIKGHGSFLNGQKIQASTVKNSKEAYICYGKYNEKFSQDYHELIKNFQSVRNLGSAALSLAYLACGRIEGSLYYSLSAWDVAAGLLIAEEAGATVRNMDGSAFDIYEPSLLASTKEFFPLILNIIKKGQA